MPVTDVRHNPHNPEHDLYVQEDIKDAIRTREWLAGADMSRVNKWIVKEKNIPCAWYAISVLAPENHITCVHREATQGLDGIWYATAVVRKGYGIYSSTRVGASRYHEKKIALAFACRNAIKWLLPQQSSTERMAYRDTQRNAIERYA